MPEGLSGRIGTTRRILVDAYRGVTVNIIADDLEKHASRKAGNEF